MELEQFIDYDEWANRKVFSAIKDLPESKTRTEIYGLFSHLLAAQIIWMNRVTGITNEVELWPDPSLAEMETLLNENPAKLRTLIPKASQTIRYSNSSGTEFQNSVGEILTHLTIHGQHHRAQIATLLRQSGITPPGTDLIFFLRSSNN